MESATVELELYFSSVARGAELEAQTLCTPSLCSSQGRGSALQKLIPLHVATFCAAIVGV